MWYLSYWYFLNYNFKFQPNVASRCHDLLMMPINFSNIAILNIEDSDYHYIISLISENAKCYFDQNKWKFLNHKKHDKFWKDILKWKQIENLVILKSKSKNFTNIKDPFQ